MVCWVLRNGKRWAGRRRASQRIPGWPRFRLTWLRRSVGARTSCGFNWMLDHDGPHKTPMRGLATVLLWRIVSGLLAVATPKSTTSDWYPSVGSDFCTSQHGWRPGIRQSVQEDHAIKQHASVKRAPKINSTRSTFDKKEACANLQKAPRSSSTVTRPRRTPDMARSIHHERGKILVYSTTNPWPLVDFV